MYPKSSPGINQTTLLMVIVQFFYMRSEPTIIIPKYTPRIPILLPRVCYQKMAKRIPPEPFHPKYMLERILATERTHRIFNLWSKASTGKQGMSSYFRIMVVQLKMKAISIVTKEYWSRGISKVWASRMCTIIITGTRMINTRFDRVILGSAPNSLQAKSCQSRLAMEAMGTFCEEGVSIDYSVTNFL